MSNFSSDCDSSFATESQADNEYFWNEETTTSNVCLPNYTIEVEEILRKNVDVTTSNAIDLNRHYQAKLRLLRAQLETLLSQCQARLVDVDATVDSLRHNRKESIPYRIRAAGYICGQPFFKDQELYPGPHNADYLFRKNVKKEFFPLDMFEVTEAHWTQKDKRNTKNGIWLQALEFLQREATLQAKMCNNPAKVERIKQDILSYKTFTLDAIWSKVQAYDGEFGGQRFSVDWLIISNVNVMGRHSAAACEAMWNQYLKPGLKKGPWQTEEDCLLVTEVAKQNCQDWNNIAQSVGNRSEYQCFVHFRSYFSQQAQTEKKPWTPEEDARLLRVVQQNCIGSNVVWNKVVENMPYRNKVQVYHRYKYTLMRPSKGAKFTAEEDCIITAYVQQYGDDFKFFPEHLLPGRTMKQVWARFNNTLRYVDKRAGWSLEEDKRLMSYIADHLTEEGPEKISWADCSKYLHNHSRASCRSRYYTIEKFLDTHPNGSLEDVPRRERKKLSTDVTNENWIKTIIDIKSTSNGNRKSVKNKKQRQSTDTVAECGLYEQMKFCFRYQFGHKLSIEAHQRDVPTDTKVLTHLLEGLHEPHLFSNVYYHNEVNLSMVNAIINAPQHWVNQPCGIIANKTSGEDSLCLHRIPPNYNTILGLRGVCLNSHSLASVEMLTNASSNEKKRLNNTKDALYDRTLLLFVNRFKKMFHWSMLLATLSIDDVKFEAEQELHEKFRKLIGNDNEQSTSSTQLPSETLSAKERQEINLENVEKESGIDDSPRGNTMTRPNQKSDLQRFSNLHIAYKAIEKERYECPELKINLTVDNNDPQGSSNYDIKRIASNLVVSQSGNEEETCYSLKHFSNEPNLERCSENEMIPHSNEMCAGRILNSASHRENSTKPRGAQKPVNNFCHSASESTIMVSKYENCTTQLRNATSKSPEHSHGSENHHHTNTSVVVWKGDNFKSTVVNCLESPGGILLNVVQGAADPCPGLQTTTSISPADHSLVCLTLDEDNHPNTTGAKELSLAIQTHQPISGQHHLKDHGEQIYNREDTYFETQPSLLNECIQEAIIEYDSECSIEEHAVEQTHVNKNGKEEIHIKTKSDTNSLTSSKKIAEDTQGYGSSIVEPNEKSHQATGQFDELLGTIDESFTAVDIIRILSEGRQTENGQLATENE